MGLAAAMWDDLAKAANLAQMSGLHAVMLVAVGASLLRIPHGRRECAKLERRSRRLRAMLQWPTGCGAALLRSEMGDSVVKALVDAAGLVESYKKSTLWRRVRRGRSMANQLRDTRDVVDSYCVLLLFINAHSLSQQATHHPPLTIQEVNDPMHGRSVQSVSNCPKVTATCDAQRANNDIVGEGGANSICSQTDKTDQAGCERSLPAILISHA